MTIALARVLAGDTDADPQLTDQEVQGLIVNRQFTPTDGAPSYNVKRIAADYCRTMAVRHSAGRPNRSQQHLTRAAWLEYEAELALANDIYLVSDAGGSLPTSDNPDGGASNAAVMALQAELDALEERFREHVHEQGGSPPVQQVEFLRWVGWSDDTTIDADDFARDATSSTGNVIAVPPYTGPNHPSNEGAYLWVAVDTEDGDPSFIGGGFTSFLTQGIKSGPVAYMGRNYDVWRLVFAQITDIPQGSFTFTIPAPVSGAAALIAAHAAVPTAHQTINTSNFATQAQVISSINTAQMARTEAEAAQTDADAAQATADTATTAAATAQTAAEGAQTTADSALPGRFTFGATLEMNPLVNDGTIALTNHGLGRVPDGYIAQLECLTADHGYLVGHVITDQGPDRTAVYYNATQIGVSLRQRPWVVYLDTQSGGLLTAANWKLTVRPYILTTAA